MTETIDRIRQYNIIWDFAGNYRFTPSKSYPMDEVYKNIIYGFTYKSFDTKILNSFFAYLRNENPFYEEFKFITNLLVEDISFRQLKKQNLVIEDLQKEYAKKKLVRYRYHDPDNLIEQIEKAYYGKVLNKPITEGPIFKSIYDAIFKIYTTDTSTLVDELNVVFKTYFNFERAKEEDELFEKMVEENKPQDFKSKDDNSHEEYSDENIEEQFAIGAAEFTGLIYYEDKKEDLNKNLMFLNSSQDDYHSSSEFIEDFFGKPILPLGQVEKLEKKVATGIHSNKRLYFTKGEYSHKPNAKFYKQTRREQFEKNKSYIESNFAINHRNINQLSLAIKNSLATFEEYVDITKNYGTIDSSKVWRAPVINDYDVFFNQENDEVAKFQVDLILDASASQIRRQHIVANQAYIIEKAMDQVGIPIRVTSYSTLREHTVFNVFRDYNEKNKNTEIYKFFAAGSNRDGLAFKTLHHLIDTNDDVRHIMIVLSDGKPNDEKANINTSKIKDKDQYTGEIAVDDTAFEIRNLRNDNVSILGVFTGEDEDVENAKLIYNKDFVRITNLENFSKIVSIFMKNQILN